MSEFHIETRFDHLGIRVSQRGVVTGLIFVVLDGQSFPNECWDDFVSKVLFFWMSSVRKLLSGSDREVFDFYDGTYSFSVSRQGSRDYAISFISDDLEVFAGVVDARDFEKKLVKKCDDFVQYIINGGIKYDGFSSFQKNLSSLKEEMGI